MNYQEMMKIDGDRLDNEWLHQPGLYQEVAEATARAEVDMDKAKDKIDVIRSELDRDIRLAPETFGIVKITEGAVTATINLNGDYKMAVRDHLEAKQVFLVCKGACTALEHRKKALEKLVDMRLAGLRADPKVAGVSTAETRKEQNVSVQSAVAARLNSVTSRRTSSVRPNRTNPPAAAEGDDFG